MEHKKRASQLASDFAPTVAHLLNDKSFCPQLKDKRDAYFYHYGYGGAEGAKYIMDRLIHKK